ncbi:DUF1993 domain-containing protein [Croceicoccus sp. F390]|uniref:DUF1993 domain-containing protein n=1 Tax=Croceicoccus esteveae TaxID=3075597 RepID=A0ABU2ZHA4_9SPHN|nr:DUF1993 domain-containing protein [Croceicoccus sp. F390]MDT0575586.1 DUF1993 domain-containing protein [Croceicoccus sp. F390]
MSISLHRALVPQWVQLARSAHSMIGKAQQHVETGAISQAELVNARLTDDMAPLAYQVKSIRSHSVGAIEGIRAGTFSPSSMDGPATLDEAAELLAQTIAELEAVDPTEFNALHDRHVEFRYNDFAMPFTGENFLFSFSQPNVYFHTTTAYAILRHMGVKIGKLDYLGLVWKRQ